MEKIPELQLEGSNKTNCTVRGHHNMRNWNKDHSFRKVKNHIQVASLIVTFFLVPTRSVGRGCDLTGKEGLARKGSCHLPLIREMLTPLVAIGLS